MAPPARLLGLAALAGALALPLAAEDLPSCSEAYQDPRYLETWDLKRQDWLAGCADGKSPQALLEEGQKRYTDRCLSEARQLVKDGRIVLKKLEDLCAQGRPGKLKIPGLSQTLAPPAPIAPPSPSLEQGGRKIAAWEAGVRSRLDDEHLPSLYSGKAPASGPGAVSAEPVPKPLPEIESQAESEPAAKPPEHSSSPPTPLRPTPYDKDLEKILRRVVRHEASEESLREAHRVIRMITTEMPASVRQNLVKNKTQVEIIPKDKKLTDLPNFAVLIDL